MPPHNINVNALKFTEKQLEVIELISCCYTNEEIAEKLNISKETVKSHIKNIYKIIDPNYKYHGTSVCRVRTALIGRELAKRKDKNSKL